MNDFFQYVEADSFLHKLDPRTKFAFLVVMSVITSVVTSGVALLFLFAVYLIIWKVGKVDRYLLVLVQKLKPLLLFIFLLWLLLGLFQVNSDLGAPLFQAQFRFLGSDAVFSFEWYDLYKGAVFALRVYLMVATFYLVILTTNFSQIILGLRSWHVPYSVAFGIGLVFQLIPMMVKEFFTIMEAQSSRGLEVEKCGVVAKIKNYLIVSLPLFFRVLGKGHSISLAMHYYRLNFKVKRTSYKVIKATAWDAAFAAITAAAAAGTLVLHSLYYIQIQ